MIPSFAVGAVACYEVDGAICWRSGLAVDADGGRHAYRVGGGGLDSLHNAMRDPTDTDLVHPAHGWAGIVVDAAGNPVAVGDYYVSTTAMGDPAFGEADPRRYVDSETVAYLSIPPQLEHQGVHLGDVGLALYRQTSCAAIIADVGPAGRLGEGSIALATALGLPCSPRDGGISYGVRYIIWPGSAASPRWPRTALSVDSQVSSLLAAWGGCERLRTVV